MSSRWIPRITSSGSGGGPPPVDAQDRFAPTILVGNVPAGDSAVAYDTDGFVYIPDTGNGAGIEAAVTRLGGGPGRIYVRRGDYDFDLAGAPLTAIVLPASTVVSGEGVGATVVTGRSSGSQGIFSLADSCQLTDMTLSSPVADAAGVGLTGVVEARSKSVLRDLNVIVAAAATGTLRAAVSLVSGSETDVTILDNVRVSMSTKTGSAAPTVGLRMVNGSYAQVTNFTSTGGDVAISTDRSFLKAVNIDATGFAVSAVIQTNSTNVSLGGGSIQMSNFRFVADGTLTAIVINIAWSTSTFANGYVGGAGGAHGLLVYRAGTNLSSNLFSNIYFRECLVSAEFRGTFYQGLDSCTFIVPATGTGVISNASFYLTVTAPRLSMTTGTGFDLWNGGGAVSIVTPMMNINDAGANTAIAVRIRTVLCQVTGGYIQASSMDVPILIEAAGYRANVSNVQVYAVDAVARPLIRITGTDSCVIANNGFTSFSRNYAKIELIATFGNVVNGNRVEGSVGPQAILLAADTSSNQVVGNYCRGSILAPVTDLGVLNNVASNYGS